MRYVIALFLVSVVALAVLAQEKKPPVKLVFEAKLGNVTYDHAAHLKRAKGDCKVCHGKLWPQEKAPLNFKAENVPLNLWQSKSVWPRSKAAT